MSNLWRARNSASQKKAAIQLAVNASTVLITTRCCWSCGARAPLNEGQYLKKYDESSECAPARQHKVAEVACYRLERTLMGCADPRPLLRGVGAPHQCSRVLRTRSEWGEFVTYIHKNNVPTIANMSECLVEPFRAAAFVPSSSGLFNIPVDWIIATTKRKQCNGIFKPQCTAQLDGGSTISPWTELNSAAYV